MQYLMCMLVILPYVGGGPVHPRTEKSCIAMHTFQNTYDVLKAKLFDINAEMSLLKDDLDNAIEQTCGVLGTLGTGNTHLYQLTYCNFEEKDDDDECTFRPEHFVINQDVSDHTFGSTLGHVYTYTPYYYSGSKLTSVKMFQPANAYCIRFYFKLQAAAAGSIKLYLQVGEHPGYAFHTIPATSLPAEKWILAEASPDQEYLQQPFKIILENSIRTIIYIDDIMVYNARCDTDGIRSPVCPFGSFTRKEGTNLSCYTFHPEPLMYVDAIKSCKRVWPDASLLQIESAEEQTYITYQINKSRAMTYAADFGIWIGGNDVDTEHKFVWIGNENPIPFNYTNWHQGQPNNMNGDQDCVMLQYRTNNNDYEWGDVGCAEKHSFICEMTYDVSHASSHQYPNTVIG